MLRDLRVVGIQAEGPGGEGFVLTANTTLHTGDSVAKELLMLELAAYRAGADNLPVDRTLGRPENQCWIHWPGNPPTIEAVNSSLSDLLERPPKVQITDYPQYPGCLLVRCSDRIGQTFLQFILGVTHIEGVVHLAGVPFYNQNRTLVATVAVGSNPLLAGDAINKLLNFP